MSRVTLHYGEQTRGVGVRERLVGTKWTLQNNKTLLGISMVHLWFVVKR